MLTEIPMARPTRPRHPGEWLRRRCGPGRPSNPIPSELLAVRVPRPLVGRFRAAAQAAKMGFGPYMVQLLERALPVPITPKHERGETKTYRVPIKRYGGEMKTY